MPRKSIDHGTVLHTNTFGDLVENSFIGVWIDESTKTIVLHLRCVKDSKVASLEDKVQRLLAHGKTADALSDEEQKELAALLLESVQEKSEKVKKFKIQAPTRNVIIFKDKSLEVYPIILAQINTLQNILSRLTDVRDFNTLLTLFKDTIDNPRSNFKQIETVDEEGNGTYL